MQGSACAVEPVLEWCRLTASCMRGHTHTHIHTCAYSRRHSHRQTPRLLEVLHVAVYTHKHTHTPGSRPGQQTRAADPHTVPLGLLLVQR